MKNTEKHGTKAQIWDRYLKIRVISFAFADISMNLQEKKKFSNERFFICIFIRMEFVFRKRKNGSGHEVICAHHDKFKKTFSSLIHQKRQSWTFEALKVQTNFRIIFSLRVSGEIKEELSLVTNERREFVPSFMIFLKNLRTR